MEMKNTINEVSEYTDRSGWWEGKVKKSTHLTPNEEKKRCDGHADYQLHEINPQLGTQEERSDAVQREHS